MSLSLPDRPNLEQLRKQAKDLLKAHKQGDASVCPILRHLSHFATSPDEDILKAMLALSEAQHALAREYGFKNWAALVRCVRKSALPRQTISLHNVIVENLEKSGMFGMVLRRTGRACKCRLCDNPATIHVTSKSEGRLVEQHYCVKHAEEDVFVQGSSRRFLYPVKYSITVSLTQDQLDRQEDIRVTLPDGSVVPVRFPRDVTDGLMVLAGPKPEAAEKYCVRYVLKIIPPLGQR